MNVSRSFKYRIINNYWIFKYLSVIIRTNIWSCIGIFFSLFSLSNLDAILNITGYIKFGFVEFSEI